MAELSPEQQELRHRTETLIRLMAPALDLILGAGERVSRIVEPEDHDYYPARPLGERPATRQRGTRSEGLS
jgi:hypothetical protein